MLVTLARKLTSERLVVWIILVNTLALFLDAFPIVHRKSLGWLNVLDQICTLFFILEIVARVYLNGFRTFWANGWNRFDFWIVLLSLPSLLTLFFNSRAFSVILLLRLGRLIKFFRLLRFTPNGEHIWQGILRSLKASVSVFLAIFLLNLLFAMGATFLFGELAPEFFGDPLKAWYSLFKVFTVEGWYEVPDLLYERTGASSWAAGLRAYYVIAVFIGGILGFALANAVFVDEMTADNTDYVEQLVQQLAAAQSDFRQEVQLHLKMMEQMQQELHELKGLMQRVEAPKISELPDSEGDPVC